MAWSEVDEIGQAVRVKRDLIRIRGQKGWQIGKPKTKAGFRTVPLPPAAWAELQAWRVQQKRQRLLAGSAWQDVGFVFTTSKGTPLHGARRAFTRLCARAGLGTWGPEPVREHPTGPLAARPFTPAFRIYDCRHMFVTLLLLNGVPVNVVSALAGHTNPAFTIARYGHALPRHTQAAAQTLQSVLFRVA